MNMGQQEYTGKLWKFMINAVHPDTNPEMKKVDNKVVGERVSLVMSNKNNETFLVKVARKWGIELPKNVAEWQQTIEYVFGYTAIYKGNFVDVLYTKRGNKVYFSGWIVDIQFEMETRRKVIYFVTNSGIIKIIKVKRENEEIIRSDNEERSYQEYRNAIRVYEAYKRSEKAKEKKQVTKEKNQKYKDLFAQFGLKMNTDYSGMGKKVKHNGIWYKVVKTTTRKVRLSYLNINVEIKIEDIKR